MSYPSELGVKTQPFHPETIQPHIKSKVSYTWGFSIYLIVIPLKILWITVYLWEGVTLYLSEDAVRSTLRTLTENSASGSHLVCDFYSLRFLKNLSKAPGASTLKQTGETLHFGLDFTSEWEQRLRSFVESERLTLTDIHFLGANAKSGPFMAVGAISL